MNLQESQEVIDATLSGRRLVAVAVTGSTLYNLATTSSDLDLLLVTEEKEQGWVDRHTKRDGLDLTVTSFDSFLSRLLLSTPNYVDILHADTLQVGNRALEPVIRGVRPNPWLYYMEATKQMTALLNKDPLTMKDLKLLFRVACLRHRFERDYLNYSAAFSEDERHTFFDRLEVLEESVSRNPKDLESVYNLLIKFAF